jgi:hypothetical protein
MDGGGRWVKLAVTAMLLAGLMLVPGGSRDAVAQGTNSRDAELVYLDQDGVIRVLDPQAAFAGVTLNWFSPESGWKDFALADVTADGDDEIVAIRDEGTAGRLRIYDPVAVGLPDDQVQFLDDVPWAVLYDAALPGHVFLIGSGEFDTGRAGAEIVYMVELPPAQQTPEDHYQVVIQRAATDAADGRAWETLATFTTGNRWTWLAAGELDGSGIDEIALVANDLGNLSVFRVVNGAFARIYRNVNEDNEWRAVEFGQFSAGGAEELAAVRAADWPLASAWVFRWDGTAMQDAAAWTFMPSPRLVFMGDIAGNGDDELVMLRNVRQELGTRPRLIVRDNANEGIVLTEAQLDGDDGYAAGAVGDFDGDGRDEIAVMRSIRIRIYTTPEQSSGFESYDRSNGAEILRAGNLDGAGLARSPRLGATPPSLSLTARAGTATNVQTVRVADVTTASTVPVTGRLEGGSGWANWSLSGTTTPLNFNLFGNAAGMQPGVYVDHVVIDAQPNDVANDPLRIPITLTVESGVTATPDSLEFNYYPCAAAAPRAVQVQLSGEAGKLFSTQIQGAPAWVTVEPTTGELPAAATVRVEPEQRPANVVDAVLTVAVDWPGAPDTRERVPIRLVCGDGRALLPQVFGAP